jgi:asparagine synthase (glutamine-hydrolysing)
MCGLLVSIDLRLARLSGGKLISSLNLMAHRGPDATGVIYAENDQRYKCLTSGSVDSGNSSLMDSTPWLFFGHKLLAIVSNTSDSIQPITCSHGDHIIAFNGEIYNWKSLRTDLESLGHQFRLQTDTEVILEAYKAWGPDCVKRFNGVWSICIYSQRSRELWVSRDRFGVKPLVFYFDEQRLLVASEQQALVPLIDNLMPFGDEIRSSILDGPAEGGPLTCFKNIHRFPSSTSMLFLVDHASRRIKQVSKLKYFEFFRSSHFYQGDQGSDASIFERILKRSISLRTQHNVCDCLALSGGIDSSLLYMFLSDLKEAPATISSIFNNENDNQICELKNIMGVISETSEFSKSRNMFVDASEKASIEDELKFLRSFGGVYNDFMAASFFVYKRAADMGYKVVYDGQGADELFAGYPRFLNFFQEDSGFANFIHTVRTKIFAANPFNNKDEVQIGRASDLEYRRTRLGMNEFQGNELDSALNIAVNFNLQNLVRYVDSLSMINSVESRQPYLDVNVATFSLGLAPSRLIKGRKTKIFLREMAAKRSINLGRLESYKLGWPHPRDRWLSNQQYRNEVISCISKSTALAEVCGHSLKQNYVAGKSNRSLMRLRSAAIFLDEFFN